MFAVDSIDDTLSRLQRHGVALVGEVAHYESLYRLYYVRGPEGMPVGLAEQLGSEAARQDPLRKSTDVAS